MFNSNFELGEFNKESVKKRLKLINPNLTNEEIDTYLDSNDSKSFFEYINKFDKLLMKMRDAEDMSEQKEAVEDIVDFLNNNVKH